MDDANSISEIKGPLDSDNTFVAEYLLRKAGVQLPSVFFRRVQAGFVFDYYHEDLYIYSKDCSDDKPYQIVSYTMKLTATIWYNNQVSHIYTHCKICE